MAALSLLLLPGLLFSSLSWITRAYEHFAAERLAQTVQPDDGGAPDQLEHVLLDALVAPGPLVLVCRFLVLPMHQIHED